MKTPDPGTYTILTVTASRDPLFMREFEAGFDYYAVSRPTPSARVAGRESIAMPARGGRQRSGHGAPVSISRTLVPGPR